MIVIVLKKQETLKPVFVAPQFASTCNNLSPKLTLSYLGSWIQVRLVSISHAVNHITTFHNRHSLPSWKCLLIWNLLKSSWWKRAWTIKSSNLCMDFEAGSLSRDDEGMLSHEWNRFYLEKIENSLMLSFLVVILCHQPKTLSRAVILSARIQGHSSEGKVGYWSEEGKVFVDSKQLAMPFIFHF